MLKRSKDESIFDRDGRWRPLGGDPRHRLFSCVAFLGKAAPRLVGVLISVIIVAVQSSKLIGAAVVRGRTSLRGYITGVSFFHHLPYCQFRKRGSRILLGDKVYGVSVSLSWGQFSSTLLL